MKKTVEETLRESLRAGGYEPPEHIELEVPKDESMGDLATPIALSLGKALKKNPRQIAEGIVKGIPPGETFEKVEVAGPGYINFTFKKGFLYSSLKALLKDGRAFLRRDIGGGRSLLIEFVSANPTGPLHLGHGRGAAVGSALANLLEAGGFRVEKQYYINDAGRQVALLGQSAFARYKELLGVQYPFPEDGYRGQYVYGIAEEIIKKKGDAFKDAGIGEAGEFFTGFSLNMMLEEIRLDLRAFGIEFDSWQSERELFREGGVEKALAYLRENGHLYESEGALWFRASSFGDEKDRVVRKSDGEFTYFASDIAYHKKKADAGFDGLIDIWGADHHGYIPRIEAVMDALGAGREKLRVLLVQMVTLLRAGKPVLMSKRAGEFITLREVAEEVGPDTTKFIFLTRRPDSHLEFDIEAAKAASPENPVYYVQYANARIGSIFAHAKGKGVAPGEAPDLTLLSEPEEIRLIKKLLLYPMVFEAAVLSREPHRITYYLQELSSLFHYYYNRHRVVGEDPGLTMARLSLCEAVRTVLREGLDILGVTAPERM